MTRNEFYRALEAKIPSALSAEWDNDGALCLPDGERAVEKILCTLDVTDAVLERAQKEGCDLILSHHPLIFGGVRALNGIDPISRRLLCLVQNDIAVFSFHTRLDAVECGINDALASMLSLERIAPLGEGEASLGRIGDLPEKMTFADFCEKVKQLLGAPVVKALKCSETVSRVAVVGGEGKDFIRAAKAAGADTYLSGRLGYHAMIDGELNLIEGGHYYTEKHAADLLATLAKEILPSVKTEIYTHDILSIY